MQTEEVKLRYGYNGDIDLEQYFLISATFTNDDLHPLADDNDLF